MVFQTVLVPSPIPLFMFADQPDAIFDPVPHGESHAFLKGAESARIEIRVCNVTNCPYIDKKNKNECVYGQRER
jgi:hypothetical protein